MRVNVVERLFLAVLNASADLKVLEGELLVLQEQINEPQAKQTVPAL